MFGFLILLLFIQIPLQRISFQGTHAQAISNVLSSMVVMIAVMGCYFVKKWITESEAIHIKHTLYILAFYLFLIFLNLVYISVETLDVPKQVILFIFSAYLAWIPWLESMLQSLFQIYFSSFSLRIKDKFFLPTLETDIAICWPLVFMFILGSNVYISTIASLVPSFAKVAAIGGLIIWFNYLLFFFAYSILKRIKYEKEENAENFLNVLISMQKKGGTHQSAMSSAIMDTIQIFQKKNENELLLNFDQLCFDSLLGKGGGGTVLKGYFTSNRKPFAAKIILSQFNDEVDEVITEIQMLCQLKHPHVVELYGITYKDEAFILIEEFIEYNLEQYLETFFSSKSPSTSTKQSYAKNENHLLAQENVSFPWAMTLSFAIQIVSALQFIHTKNIAHRDIKPSNILIDLNTNLLKFCDLGMATLAQENRNTTLLSKDSGGGTPGYAPPEVYKGGFSKTTKVNRLDMQKWDIFSTAMLFFWMLEGKHPFIEYESVVDVIDKIKDGDRPTFSSNLDNYLIIQFRELIEEMWHQEAGSRPTIEDVYIEVLRLKKETASSKSPNRGNGDAFVTIEMSEKIRKGGKDSIRNPLCL